jgi:2-polyprenyl-3-methyl-5-hydroxy-6-metoxy-1,4-benzoquinol methylase
MNEELLERVNCNVCEENDYKVLYEAKYENEEQQDLKDKFKSSGDETLIDQVVKCKKCNMIYVNPRIRQDLVIEGYSEGTDEAFVGQAKGREITFKKSLKLINKYAKKGRILDIGTAGGSFLHVAKEDGWEVHGIEPNKWMCEWGKKHYGIDIKPGTIFDHKFPDDHFDAVCLWDVLEHVPDPKKTLKECNRILKEDGVLIVNYPDIGSWLARLMKRRWIFLLSVHLYYFTPKTITKILNMTGYKVEKIKPHFQKLAIGYLMWRMKAYSKIVHHVGTAFIKLFRMKEVQVPYWLGQTLVIARKVKKE